MAGFNPMNTREYIENCLKIRTKEGGVVPFRLNKPQQKLYAAVKRQSDAGLPVRLIVLKARQMGFSTLIGGMMFHRCATGMHKQGVVISHDAESTRKLFEMHKRFLDLLPQPVKPRVAASNGYQIVFNLPAQRGKTAPQGEGLDSSIEIATAGGKGVGRGSTRQYVHMSEYAFWPGDPNENFTAVMQTLPQDPNTMAFIESTAFGYNDFKTKWDEAVERERRGELDGFIPVFFAWFEMDEYRRTPPPNFVRTEEEQEIALRYGLDDEQLYWRRWKIANDCGGRIDQFHQEYPACPEEAFIASGSCVFDQAAIIARIEELRKAKVEPVRVGAYGVTYGGSVLEIKQWQWREDPRGCIRIYAEPEKGVPYVIGADTAGSDGKDKDSDYFAAHVLDNRTGRQVAVLHGRLGEREFTEQLYCLGKAYNNALIGIETNYSTYPNELIQLMGYRRLYVQQRTDDFRKTVITKFGWDTNMVTRPLIIDGLKDVAKYHMELIGDVPTLREMLVFIKNAAGRPEAEVGQHDDLVMSLAISHYIRGQQTTAVRGGDTKRRRWTEDMLADYYDADAAGRARMEQRWGRPDDEDEEE